MIEWMILAAALLGAAGAIATMWIVADLAWQVVRSRARRDFPRARVHRIKDCALIPRYARCDARVDLRDHLRSRQRRAR